jgi:hypothetical protein
MYWGYMSQGDTPMRQFSPGTVGHRVWSEAALVWFAPPGPESAVPGITVSTVRACEKADARGLTARHAHRVPGLLHGRVGISADGRCDSDVDVALESEVQRSLATSAVIVSTLFNPAHLFSRLMEQGWSLGRCEPFANCSFEARSERPDI